MSTYEEDALRLLREIRDLLEPVSANFKDEFIKDRYRQLSDILTPKTRRVFPLLFDPRHLSQVQIANEAGTTQPTVSRIISSLLERNLIKEKKDSNFNSVFEDVHDLNSLLEIDDEQ